MARISLDWNTSELPREVTEPGYAGIETTVADFVKNFAGDKPSIVYFFDPREKPENDRVASTVLGNEVVGTAARGFNLVKIDVTRIQREDLKAEYSKSTPKFQFYSREGDVLAKVERGITLPDFTSAITKAFNAEYSVSLQQFLKSHRSFLDRLDRAEAKKTRVAEKKTLLESSTRRDARSAALEKEIVKEEKEAQDEVDKALSLEEGVLAALKLRPVSKN
jgi:hypothetical protein